MRGFCSACLFLFIISIFYFLLIYYKAPDIPYSALFKYDKNDKVLQEQVLSMNKKRYKEATDYLSTLNLQTFEKYNYDKNSNSIIDLSVVVISVKRDKNQRGWYLTQALAHLFKATESFNGWFGPLAHKSIKVSLCNVHKSPKKHKELLKFSKNIHTITKYNYSYEQNISDHEKESLDYQFCIKKVKSVFSPRYMLVLQDDALVHLDIFDVINEKLQYLQTKWPQVSANAASFDHLNNDIHSDIDNNIRFPAASMSTEVKSMASMLSNSSKQDWLMIKLFYPTKWGGYGFEFGIILELISTATVSSSLLTLATYAFYYIVSRVIFRTEVNTNILMVYQHFVFFLLACITTFLMIGRPTIMQWRRLSPALRRLVAPPGCCIPAIFYNIHNIGYLLDYLASHSSTGTRYDTPVDLLIDDFVTNFQFVSYLLEPNVATHIGFHSSLKHPKSALEFV